MNDAIWYYVDRAQQRIGPVTADALVAAWHAGDASDASLVWREGLADWRPLAEYRAELGLGAAAAAADAPPAPPPGPLSAPGAPAGVASGPKKQGSGCLVVGIVLAVGFLVIVGILAAIAIPAYNEYKAKAEQLAEEAAAAVDGAEYDGSDGAPGENESQGYVDLDGDDGDGGTGAFSTGSAPVAAALAEARAHQAKVDDFVANAERCPRDADELQLPAPTTPGVESLVVGVSGTRMCTITVTFGGAEAGAMAGESIVLSRDGGGDWYCTSDMSDRSGLPSDCY